MTGAHPQKHRRTAREAPSSPDKLLGLVLSFFLRPFLRRHIAVIQFASPRWHRPGHTRLHRLLMFLSALLAHLVCAPSSHLSHLDSLLLRLHRRGTFYSNRCNLRRRTALLHSNMRTRCGVSSTIVKESAPSRDQRGKRPQLHESPMSRAHENLSWWRSTDVDSLPFSGLQKKTPCWRSTTGALRVLPRCCVECQGEAESRAKACGRILPATTFIGFVSAAVDKACWRRCPGSVGEGDSLHPCVPPNVGGRSFGALSRLGEAATAGTA